MSDDIFAAIVANTPVRAATADEALLAAMVRVEVALARVQSNVGFISTDAADSIERASTGIDAETIAGETRSGGNPVIPLVSIIRSQVGPRSADSVHRGATSQDILDTALMLLARTSLRMVDDDLERIGAAINGLDAGTTQMTARTLMQKAVPMQAADKLNVWTRAAADLQRRVKVTSAQLPVQLGGPVGDGATFGPDYEAIRAGLATELGLVDSSCWHTVRIPIADLVATLTTTCGVIAKIAGDIILLAQTEVGEVHEAGEGHGGSSSMAHKSNPIAAISARASARRAPFLAAQLFAQMEQEHERAAAAWHAEWAALVDLLRATGSASNWLLESLERLVLNTDAMERNS